MIDDPSNEGRASEPPANPNGEARQLEHNSTPDPLQPIRDDLQRRETERTNQADQRARREQLTQRWTGRFMELLDSACILLARKDGSQGGIDFRHLACRLLAFNEALQECDREYPRYRILERLGRASRAGVPALDTAASLLLATPSSAVEQMAHDLEQIAASRPHDLWPAWLTYILDHLLNSHCPPAKHSVPPDTTRDEWRKAELAFGCVLFSDESFGMALDSTDRAAALVDDALRGGGYRVLNHPPARVRDLISWFDPRALNWYGSESPSLQLLQPPASIEVIAEPPALRRQLDEVWTAANCLRIALDQWAAWFVELGEKGDAHPAIALNCEDLACRAIRTLLTYHPNVAPFNTADESTLFAMLPPIPSWWMPEAAPAVDQAERAGTRRVRWQEDREWLDRYYWPPERRTEKAHELRGAACQLIELLKIFPMAAVQPHAAGRGQTPLPSQLNSEGGAAKGDNATLALMRVFTNGIADDRIKKATGLLANDQLNANDKLTKIDALIPFPATASAEQLGEMLGVTKQAVLKTDWWIQNRKGEKKSEVGRRREGHRKRAKGYEAPGQDDEDE
jgi:hypothetical protein